MEITKTNLDDLYRGFLTAFNKSFGNAPKDSRKIATRISSSTLENQYAWLGSFPNLQEWIGDRVINNLSLHSYAIRNKNFELTVSVRRDSIEDDQYGIYAPMFASMGEEAAAHPEKLIFGLMKDGHNVACYDEKPFFSTEHPVGKDKILAVSNNLVPTTDEGEAWYLLCTKRAMLPFIFQERRDYTLVRMDKETDENVFMRAEYLYGVDARVNVGFGLWQMAVRSTYPLTPDNYAKARAAMTAFKNDSGNPLGLIPDTLVVPTALEAQARTLINCELIEGSSNPWHGSAELLVTPWL